MTTGKAVASTTKFEQTLQASTQLPGVRIDRNAFLAAELQRFCTPEQIACAIASTPAEAGVPLSVIDEIAKSVINFETAKVTTLSAAAGLPGGFTAIATVPADIAQYYGHVLRVVQKLAYLYSWPDLFDPNGTGLNAATQSMLTLFVGVMFGVNAAQAGVSQVSALMAKQVAKQLPKQALTKGTIYPIVKKVSGLLGVRMTTQIFAKGASKVVPVVGAVVSGGLTFATFKPMSKRLQRHLRSLPLTHPNLAAQQAFGPAPEAPAMVRSRKRKTSRSAS